MLPVTALGKEVLRGFGGGASPGFYLSGAQGSGCREGVFGREAGLGQKDQIRAWVKLPITGKAGGGFLVSNG